MQSQDSNPRLPDRCTGTVLYFLPKQSGVCQVTHTSDPVIYWNYREPINATLDAPLEGTTIEK